MLLKSIFIFLVIIFSGAGNTFIRSTNAILILFGISIVYSFIFKLKLTKSFIQFIIIWSLYFLSNYLVNGYLNYLLFFRIVIYAYISFVFLNLLPIKELLYQFERIIFVLSAISLILFFVEVLAGNALFSILSKINLSGGLFSDIISVRYVNIVVYTILRYPGEMIRNCGFTWEPGPFSIFVAFALLFFYLRTHFAKFLTTKSIIFILALLTTFSTTGYLMLFVIFLTFLAISKKINQLNKPFFYFIFLIIFLIVFFETNFLYSKIKELYSVGQTIEYQLNSAARSKTSFSAGRFGGFIIAQKNFFKSPILGISGLREYSFGSFGQDYAAIISGLASIISNYGLFGVFILGLFLNRGGNIIRDVFNASLKYVYILLYLIALFAFNIHDLLFFFSLLLLGIFTGYRYHLNYLRKPV
ncbi:MAG: hypothetical protein HPY74_15120 [Firmicutes bacterium]|nr:hypothetical protein [Bacillota bacterium]